ncbi:uncharacterized protein LOC135498952 [Lineus longissimus]|uniref:uncharacterized protein LOC135498952 n=1 Tax=Lineus longissimus TaxID=88925 RepID=UPI00315C83BA
MAAPPEMSTEDGGDYIGNITEESNRNEGIGLVLTEVDALQESLTLDISPRDEKDDRLPHQSNDEPTTRKRKSGSPNKSGSSQPELEMSCVEAELQPDEEVLTSKRRSGHPKKPVFQKTKSSEASAPKKRRTSKKFLDPALLAKNKTSRDDIEKSPGTFKTNLPQRARRLASLAIPKCMAEFAQQAKLIKRAMEEEKNIEKKIVKLPEGIQPKLTQRVSEKNDVPEFSCGLCDRTADSMAKLIEHFKDVHGVGTLLQLGRPKGKKHRLDHGSDSRREEILTCGFCGKTERSTKALMMHFVLMHPASSTTIADDKKPAGTFVGSGDFVCGLCGVQKDKDTELMGHYRVAHPVFPPPFGGEPKKNAPTGNRRKQNLKTIKENAQMNFRITGSKIVAV